MPFQLFRSWRNNDNDGTAAAVALKESESERLHLNDSETGHVAAKAEGSEELENVALLERKLLQSQKRQKLYNTGYYVAGNEIQHQQHRTKSFRTVLESILDGSANEGWKSNQLRPAANMVTKRVQEMKPTPDDEFEWPEEIIFQVFKFLDARDLTRVGLVCKRWNQIAEDQVLWKNLFHRHFFFHLPFEEELDWKEEYMRRTEMNPWWSKSRAGMATLRSHKRYYTFEGENPAVRSVYFDDYFLVSGGNGEAVEWDLSDELWTGRSDELPAEVDHVHFCDPFIYGVTNNTVRSWYRGELYALGSIILKFHTDFKFGGFDGEYFAIYKPSGTVVIYHHAELFKRPSEGGSLLMGDGFDDITTPNTPPETDTPPVQQDQTRGRRNNTNNNRNEDDDDDDDDESSDDDDERIELDFEEEIVEEGYDEEINPAVRKTKFKIDRALEHNIVKVFLNQERKQISVFMSDTSIHIYDLLTGDLLRSMKCIETLSSGSRVKKVSFTFSGLVSFSYRSTSVDAKNRLTKNKFISVYDCNQQMLLVDSDQSAYAFYNNSIQNIHLVGHLLSPVLFLSSFNQVGVWRIQCGKLLLLNEFEVKTLPKGQKLTCVACTNSSIAVGTSVGDITFISKKTNNLQCVIS